MHSTPEYAEAKFMEWTAVDGCIEPTSVHGHAIRLIIKGIKRLAPGNNYEILDAARARLDIFHAERFGKSQKEGNWKTFTDFEKFCIENLA